MGVFDVKRILIAVDRGQDWVVSVGGAFSRHAVPELAFVSFLLNVDGLVSLV